MVCVVAESSADYALAPTLGAAALALAAPWPLLAFAHWPALHAYLAQLLVFALALGLIALAPVRARLATRARRRSACHRAAVVQFALRGLDRAHERNGALLYVSVAERYARVVADVGLHVPQEAWRELIDELGMSLRKGAPAPALSAAARRMGELLAQGFPPNPGGAATNRKAFHML